MKEIPGLDRIHDFVSQFNGVGILSTGAEVVNYSGGLYNVEGSTEDPKEVPDHTGDSWKSLLISKAGLRKVNCYVTNVVPPNNTSHPNFSVGGHMTPASDGKVEVGADSYLMPLCKWHNSTARDGVKFSHTETLMLKLTGYMQGELATTFELRRRTNEPYALLYFDPAEGIWKHQNLSKNQALSIESESLLAEKDKESPNYHILFERSNDSQPLHFIKDVNLPAI